MTHLAQVIGNDFDIDAGLPAKYYDFVNSQEWENSCKCFQGLIYLSGYKDNSLVTYLQKVYGKKDGFDIEKEFYNFVKTLSNCDNRVIVDIRNEFNTIIKLLISQRLPN